MEISSTHCVTFSGIFSAEARVSHTPNAQVIMSIGGASRQEAIDGPEHVLQHSSDSFYTGYIQHFRMVSQTVFTYNARVWIYNMLNYREPSCCV